MPLVIKSRKTIFTPQYYFTYLYVHKKTLIYVITPRYLDFSFPLRDLHSSRVFPTNKRPRARSRTVNGKDLTHRDVPYYSHSQPLSATRTKARVAVTCFRDIGAERNRWWKTVIKMGRTSREYSPMWVYSIGELQRSPDNSHVHVRECNSESRCTGV